MCAECRGALTCDSFLTDPLIRLVMESDGVSVTEMMAVLEAAGDAMARREHEPQQQRLC